MLPSPLAGKLFDENGRPLYVQGAARRGRRYRYYVSHGLVRGSAERSEIGWRVSAPELERAVMIASQQILEDSAAINSALRDLEAPADLKAAFDAASDWSGRLQSETDAAVALTELIERVELTESGARVSLILPIPSGRGAGVTAVSLSRFVPMKMKRRGVELRIILEGKDDAPRKVDPALLKAIARANRWFEELASGRVRSLAEIARREGIKKRYVERVARFAFVAPRVVDAVADGRGPTGVNLQMLMTGRVELALDWRDQERHFSAE